MIDRRSAFSGTEAPPEHLLIDGEALLRYLRPRIDGISGALEIAKFKGGQSNPTYRVSSDGRSFTHRSVSSKLRLLRGAL